MLAPLLLCAISASGITSLAFSGRYVVTADEGGTVRVWSSDARELLAEDSTGTPLLAVACSQTGDTIVAGGEEGWAYLWSFRMRPKKVLSRHWQSKLFGGSVTGAAVDRFGTRVGFAMLPLDRAHIFKLPIGGTPRTIEVLGNGMEGLAFHPDGKTLVTGGQNLTVWDLSKPGPTPSSREPKGAACPFPAVIGWTRSLSMDGHGSVLAGGVAFGEDRGVPRSVVLTDPLTGKVVRTFVKAGPEVYAVALSPDGKYASAADETNQVRIWRRETGELIKTLRVDDQSIRGLAFDLDSRHLAIGGKSGVVKVWPIP